MQASNVVDYTGGNFQDDEFISFKFELDKTEKQQQAIRLLATKKTQIMLYGGTRSGKTVALLYAIIVRAIKAPGSRHLVARLHLAHARASIWNETLPFLLALLPSAMFEVRKGEMCVEFWNGSEIWVDGFDKKERVEKLLGREYATIYFNECSQIPYDTVILGLSRLAQKTSLQNKAYFDCNPPSPMHWTHKLFIEGRDPKTGKPVKHPEYYGAMLMNPMDNLDNLPENYIEQFLDILPKASRDRLKYGKFVKPEGMVYDEFDMSMVLPSNDLPEMEYYCSGVDFGLNMAGVLIGWCGDTVYLRSDTGAFNTVARAFNQQMRQEKGWEDYGAYFAYSDPAGGERIQEIDGGVKANNSVDDGIDFLKMKMQNGEFFVCDECEGFLSEVWDYKRDEQGRIIKENDHFMDAARYGVYSFKKPGKISGEKTKRRPVTGGMREERF
jgi:phage terminase large subunit